MTPQKQTNAACLVSKIYLSKYRLTASDDMIFSIYQGWVHQNPGTQMDGSIEKDCIWQKDMEKDNFFVHPMLRCAFCPVYVKVSLDSCREYLQHTRLEVQLQVHDFFQLVNLQRGRLVTV